ncbi:zinc knuckle-domain-containing protein [Clohesyomyces aquaticus]|uniref:Zinc knuckle-domain-containing protein n=1 Tax=Clohesyomyces aquaticus TaxID=1231657 RepID=A0A1Y1ZF89_9PLEO|nr:zinc knuckle-domain-containing protein [Clohesyomyces aquaticus]
MYRGPSSGGRSKATPSTQCQKCLQRGHYSYECKASAQERPYKSRPSRTQQLLNPQLKPKLMTEVPDDLQKKKGVADALLAKKEEERGRKSDRGDADSRGPSRKRSRSVSTDSVSTVSTNLSRPQSRSPVRSERNGKSSLRGGYSLGKRPRRSPSSDSYRSGSSHGMKRITERNSRRRLSSFSPGERGRRRNRSSSSSMDTAEHGSRRKGDRRLRPRSRSDSRVPLSRLSISRSLSRSPRRGRVARKDRSRDSRMDTSGDHIAPPRVVRRTVSRDNRRGRSPSRRSKSRSVEREWRAVPPARRRSLSKSRSRSPARFRNGRVSRSRSRSPFRRPGSRSPPRNAYRAWEGRGRGGRFDGGRSFQDRREEPNITNNALPAPPPQRERSLSPYSKRVAMTQAMISGGR